ncbi:MAG: alginate lyase family protein, partial [Thermodesulfobacteriota bacterium]
MILEQARESQDVKYIIVPMERLLNNEDILDPDFNPTALEEPQIIFRNDSLQEFDEGLRYGRLPKVELLRRLGVPGVWDDWDYQPWENRQWSASPEFGQWKSTGWVARLFSGAQAPDGDPNIDGFRKRSRIRRVAIKQLLQKLDEQVLRRSLRTDRLLVYDESLLQLTKEAWQEKKDSALSRLADSVIAKAERALLTPPPSVVKKPSIPPSGDPHDYFSPAPFWWPNPETPDRLPHVRRDGERTPESELFSKDSEKYDYSRLQAMFECVTVLALAWHFTESIYYARHAIETIRTWFLKPATRMNPHMRYAQVRPGHDYTGRGIIEAKEFYYFLDGVRLLQRSPVCLPRDQAGLASWCEEYLSWLLTSEQGTAEAHKSNNHGTCYDLQAMALCGFLGDYAGFVEVCDRSKARLSSQV